MRDPVAHRQHDYWAVVALSQFARGKSDDPRLPTRPRKYQHASLQLARVGIELDFGLPQNAILEEFAPLIRLLRLLSQPRGLPWVASDEQLVRWSRIVETTRRIQARRYLEGDLGARQRFHIDVGAVTKRLQPYPRL